MKKDELMQHLLECDGNIRCIFYRLKKLGIKDSEFTLDEIGRMLKITRERVRQIEVQALKKIKNPRFGRSILNYLRL